MESKSTVTNVKLYRRDNRELYIYSAELKYCRIQLVGLGYLRHEVESIILGCQTLKWQ